MQERIYEYEPLWGEWYIDELIGEGSFGKVYKVKRDEFGEIYYSAVKIITIPQNESEIRHAYSEGMNSQSVKTYFENFVRDLLSEIRLMSNLKGITNIVSLEDHKIIEKVGGIGWDILIRMELLKSLPDYLMDHTLTHSEIIGLGIDICRALELCQKYNIIHRDIKPDNIFVSKHGDFKLGDFGIARQIEKTMAGLSKKGTFSYMAPEVYKGQAYNSTVDIYSLGLVLYRFLNNNRTPFLPEYPAPITHNNREEAIVRRMRGEDLPRPQNAEGRLSEIILKATAYNPKDRYENPIQMREALEVIQYSKKESEVIYPKGDSFNIIPEAYLSLNSEEIPALKNEGISAKHEEIKEKYKSKEVFQKEDIHADLQEVEFTQTIYEELNKENRGMEEEKLVEPTEKIGFETVIQGINSNTIISGSQINEQDISSVKNKRNKKKILGIMTGAFILLLVAIIFVFKLQITDSKAEIMGNTIGNINNLGTCSIQDGWIYYNNRSAGSKLYKIGTDETYGQKLYDDRPQYINVVGSWIYYSNWSNGKKIYKIRTNGTDRQNLSEESAKNINVVGNWIYYINNDNGGLFKMRIDGTDREKLSNDKCLFLNVVGNRIYYINESDGYKLYGIGTDGKNKKKLNNEDCWFVNVVGDWIYYSNRSDDNKIYKIRTDGIGRQKLNDEGSWEINVAGDWIYYLDAEQHLYKMRTSGLGHWKLSDDQIEGINIVGDWIYYGDKNDYKLYRIHTYGSEKETVR